MEDDAAAQAWRAWMPGPRDRPGRYDPTIVCRHGDLQGRSLLSSRVCTTDTPEHRTPSWWAQQMPGVAFELLWYPNGYLGRPTPKHRTREFRTLGRFEVGAWLPDFPLGRAREAAAVIVVTTPAGPMTASFSGREDARGRPVYGVNVSTWATVRRQ
jgi:hypothetical protein